MEAEQLPKEKPTKKKSTRTTFFLLNAVITGLYSFLMVISTLQVLDNNKFTSTVEAQLYATILILIVTFISTIGMWRWRQWGHYGSLIGYSLIGLVSIIAGQIIFGWVNILWAGLLYFVTKPVKELFK